jgi:hypothetical protein
MMTNVQANRPMPDEVVVRLSYDEAFVLSDFLDRWSQAGVRSAAPDLQQSNTDHRSTAKFGNGTVA